MGNKHVFKIWATNQSLGLILGWFFHSVISHLFTGEHNEDGGYRLNTDQFIMQNVSLIGCAMIFLFFQNRAFKKLFNLNIAKKGILYVLFPTGLFWTAFYLRVVPMDVLLWLISVGILNGYFTKIFLPSQANKWLLWSILSGIIGFVLAVFILIPLDKQISSLNGLAAHIVMFSLFGIVAGIPMAVIGGSMLNKFIEKEKSNHSK